MKTLKDYMLESSTKNDADKSLENSISEFLYSRLEHGYDEAPEEMIIKFLNEVYNKFKKSNDGKSLINGVKNWLETVK